jgi:hypothetical protein
MTYTPTPDTRNSIVIVKQFSYKGATRRFSNRYHFEGTLPADPTAWGTLADNITAAEKAIYTTPAEIVEAIGYDCSSATLKNLHGDAIFTKAYTLTGTLTPPGTGSQAPGDCAALFRFSTLARSVKNHPVYLFNYFHGVWLSASDQDTIQSSQLTAYNTYAAAWVTGFSDGTGARERCGPHGAGATGVTVNSHITHRDFPA